MGRAHGACEAISRREEEAMRDIGDNEQRRARPQPPCARAGICCVAAPQQCAALPASRRLASPGAALGTRPMLLLGQAPSTKRLLLSSLLSTCALVGGAAQVADKTSYRPELAVSE